MSDNPRRLCSEIQLFDICSREECRERDGKYCISETVLGKFEKIVAQEEPSEEYVDEDEADEGDDDSLYEADYYEQEDDEE